MSNRKIIECSAPWCGTCKMMQGMVKRVCDAHGVELCVVDVEKNPELATKYEVNSLPTFLKIEGDEVVDVKVGSMSPKDFEEWITE